MPVKLYVKVPPCELETFMLEPFAGLIRAIDGEVAKEVPAKMERRKIAGKNKLA